MPSRYGIVTSNAVESANSMFEDAREGSWLNSIEKSIYIMAKRISQLRAWHRTVSNVDIVNWVEQRLKRNWEDAENYDVIEVQEGEYHVSYNGIDTATGGSSSHMVDSVNGDCSCGAWRDLGYPCKHACAWALKFAQKSHRTFFDEATEFVHKGKALKFLFHVNV